ncbi:MAG: hypothetical protein U0989_20925, partial [Azonexus sp.]|nr:hypothetical protein [Azonexus sp.]
LRTLYTRGFSRFVTSTSAPVATGRNENYRTGFAPARKQRLGTAHVKDRLMQCTQNASSPINPASWIHNEYLQVIIES